MKELTNRATITEMSVLLDIPRSTLRAAIRAGHIRIQKTVGGTTLVVCDSAIRWAKGR